ncbi:MAG: protein kinase family protein [Oligoflexia bacterium]|nr:protein kinase family protein [Oligoflexia bacterium]
MNRHFYFLVKIIFFVIIFHESNVTLLASEANRLGKHELENIPGLECKTVAANGEYCFSQLINGIGGDHIEMIAYKKRESENKYDPILLYMSLSQGTWRVAPNVTETHYAKSFSNNGKDYTSETAISREFEKNLPKYALDCQANCKAIEKLSLNSLNHNKIYHTVNACCVDKSRKVCGYNCEDLKPQIYSGGPLEKYDCYVPPMKSLKKKCDEDIVNEFKKECDEKDTFIPKFEKENESYPFNHPLLGAATVYTFNAEVIIPPNKNPTKLKWHMAVGKKANTLGNPRMWIKDIEVVDDNGNGNKNISVINKKQVRGGYLLNKPIEYGKDSDESTDQVDAIDLKKYGELFNNYNKNVDDDKDIQVLKFSNKYVDITPLLSNLCPIKKFKKFLLEKKKIELEKQSGDVFDCRRYLQEILPKEQEEKFNPLIEKLEKLEKVEKNEKAQVANRVKKDDDCVKLALNALFSQMGNEHSDERSNSIAKAINLVAELSEQIDGPMTKLKNNQSFIHKIPPYTAIFFNDDVYISTAFEKASNRSEMSEESGSFKYLRKGISFNEIKKCMTSVTVKGNFQNKEKSDLINAYAVVLTHSVGNGKKTPFSSSEIAFEMKFHDDFLSKIMNLDVQKPSVEYEELVIDKKQSIFVEKNQKGENETRAVFISKLYEKGSLKLNKDDFKSGDGKAACYLRDALRGLKTLHQAGYAHRDIKQDNIFIDKNDCAAIGDFGETVKEGDIRLNVLRGSKGINHPSLFQGPFTIEELQKGDLYSLGLIISKELGDLAYDNLYENQDSKLQYKIRDEINSVVDNEACFSNDVDSIGECNIFLMPDKLQDKNKLPALVYNKDNITLHFRDAKTKKIIKRPLKDNVKKNIKEQLGPLLKKRKEKRDSNSSVIYFDQKMCDQIRAEILNKSIEEIRNKCIGCIKKAWSFVDIEERDLCTKEFSLMQPWLNSRKESYAYSALEKQVCSKISFKQKDLSDTKDKFKMLIELYANYLPPRNMKSGGNNYLEPGDMKEYCKKKILPKYIGSSVDECNKLTNNKMKAYCDFIVKVSSANVKEIPNASVLLNDLEKNLADDLKSCKCSK